MSPFDASSFDLPAYLARVGHTGPVAPDLSTLQALTMGHPLAIPFENLDPLVRRPVPLDIEALQQKMVHGERGGWCFEHNLLLGTALAAIGYEVTGLAARVLWQLPADTIRPRSHMVLLVVIEGRPYLADAGFGGLTMTAPLCLVADVEQQTPHEPFRLRSAGSDFVAEARIQEQWQPLYRFDLQPQARVDYELASWYLTTHPSSFFTSVLIAARVRVDRRYALTNGSLAIHHRDGYTERRVMATAADLRLVLEDLFGIGVPETDEVEAALARAVAAGAGA